MLDFQTKQNKNITKQKHNQKQPHTPQWTWMEGMLRNYFDISRLIIFQQLFPMKLKQKISQKTRWHGGERKWSRLRHDKRATQLRCRPLRDAQKK